MAVLVTELPNPGNRRKSEGRRHKKPGFALLMAFPNLAVAARAAGFGRLNSKDSMFFEYFACSSSTVAADSGGLVPLGRDNEGLHSDI